MTTTVSLSVTDTTDVVAPFESSNLSPSTSSLVNTDAIPVIVSLLESPSTVTVPLPVNVKLSSNKTSPPNSWNTPVPLSWCTLLILPISNVLTALIATPPDEFWCFLNVSLVLNVPTTLCSKTVVPLETASATIPVAPDTVPFTFIPFDKDTDAVVNLVNICTSNKCNASLDESNCSNALTLAKPILLPPPSSLATEPFAVSISVTVENALKSPASLMSGKPYTLLIFKKFPILNADATLSFDAVVLALSKVKNEGVCLSTSKPLT